MLNLKITSQNLKCIIRVSAITSFVMAMPVSAAAKPSVDQIKKLTPNEQYVASPYYKSFTDFISSQNISVGKKDIASVFPKIDLGIGSIIKIWRAPKYTVVDSSKEIQVNSWGTSIGEIIADGGIELGQQDSVSPTVDSLPPAGAAIAITRVKETEITETEIIKYKTIEKKDADLEKGKTRVEQVGKNGKKEMIYISRRENGKEVSRELKESKIVEEAVDKIIYIGTKVVILSSESGEASWTWGLTASRKYKRGTLIRVTNLGNGRSVETRVGGWGPMEYTGRILDLNYESWEVISSGGLGSGTMQVKVEEINE